MKAKQHGIQFGVLVAVLAAWYLLTLPGRINPILLPPPVPVVAAFGALLTTPGLWSDVFVTVCEWLVAFVLGALHLKVGFIHFCKPFASFFKRIHGPN